MSQYFECVKNYLSELHLTVVEENAAEGLVVVDDEASGVRNLVVDCEDPILIVEQFILPVPAEPGDLFRRLLQMNRTLVHGAFVLDEEGQAVLFRDTLQLENLDLNELEGSIRALSLGLAEHGAELLGFAKR